ncbi:hypothetical protein [Streptomyces hyaluromycini]|uniref:hypothetical protein n=1 Tax=Streptomyces hyaluromycini TaxID=1377993 RepID=UPI001237CFFB|nr:hypothetical protein [Streptomyces hyaluromycini]
MSLTERVQSRLGVPSLCVAWCRIGKIPEPPAEVHQAAGSAPLRPAFIRPLGIFGVILGAPLLFIGTLLSPLAAGEEALQRMLSTTGEQERHRAAKLEEKRRQAAIVELKLDRTFDGDWNGAAGQFLLRWYSRSSHHNRLLVLSQDRIILASPPKRVSIRQEEQIQVVAEIPATEAVVEDPLAGLHASDLLRVRFRDGSWLTVVTEETRSEVHMHLLRQTRTEG